MQGAVNQRQGGRPSGSYLFLLVNWSPHFVAQSNGILLSTKEKRAIKA
jgi:hypothetical protein